VPCHQRNEQAIERRLGVDQKRCCFAGVESPPAGECRQLVDERLPVPEKSFDCVTQRRTKLRCLSPVIARMQFGSSQIATFSVEVCQQNADELDAALAKPKAFGFRKIGEPAPVLILWSCTTVGTSHVIGGRCQGWTSGATRRNERHDCGHEEAAVAAWGCKGWDLAAVSPPAEGVRRYAERPAGLTKREPAARVISIQT
jgi:hypothetical protein